MLLTMVAARFYELNNLIRDIAPDLKIDKITEEGL